MERLDKEPLIRVGIILPRDRVTTLILVPSDPEHYRIETAPPLPDPCQVGKSIQLEAVGAGLVLGGIAGGRSISLRPQRAGNVNGPYLSLPAVPAGRGFHWQKTIPVKLPGEVQIGLHKRFILLTNLVPLETYLAGVVGAEMSGACPAEFLAVQSIVARSWILAGEETKHAELGIDVCNDDCCQRYQGTGQLAADSRAAVRSTAGQVLTYRDQVCDTRYCKSCGGRQEPFETVWGGPPVAYMTSAWDLERDREWRNRDLTGEDDFKTWVQSPPDCFCDQVPAGELSRYLGTVDEEGRYFRWRVEFSPEELTTSLNQKLGLDLSLVTDFWPLKRGPSGRLVHLGVGYLDAGGRAGELELRGEYEIRRVLHPRFLFSSAFHVEVNKGRDLRPEKFIFQGAGWGHGVGLCQIGALGRALHGQGREAILKHYFPGTQIATLYNPGESGLTS